MSGRRTLIFFLVLIAIAIGYVKYKYGGSSKVDAPLLSSPMPSSSIVPGEEAWKTLENEYFSLSYPKDASVSGKEEGPDSVTWRVYRIGDKQLNSGRVQTELFDGYALGITRFITVGDDAARIQANSDRLSIVNGCGEENATDIKEIKLGNTTALTFNGGCIGQAIYYYLNEGDALYRVTSLIAGEEEDVKTYASVVGKILESFKIRITK